MVLTRMKAKRAVPIIPMLSRDSSRPLCACGTIQCTALEISCAAGLVRLPKTEIAPTQPRLHPYVLNDIGPYLGSPGQGRILADHSEPCRAQSRQRERPAQKNAKMTPVRRAAPPFRHRLSNPLMLQKTKAAINAAVDLDANAIPTKTNNIQSLPRYRRGRP